MQFTYRIHHTPTQMHSHILSHTHSYTTLYHMLHTPAHMHTYILIDTHTPHTHPRILYALHTHSGTLTHTHTPHIPYASYTCSCALVHTHRHTHHTHTHTLHTTHTICGSGWGLITSMSRNNAVSPRCPCLGPAPRKHRSVGTRGAVQSPSSPPRGLECLTCSREGRRPQLGQSHGLPPAQLSLRPPMRALPFRKAPQSQAPVAPCFLSLLLLGP